MSDEHRMSRMEAMMWNVESDPWLDPNGGSVTIYDRPLDVDRFRRSLARAVADVPRLRQRVVPGLGGLSTPRWVPDHEFDLYWHVRNIGAPGDGSLRGLLDYFTPWLQDPYDRTRPLWMYVVVDGMADGQGALLTKIHHTVGDGESLVKMALAYTETERDVALAPDVDLDAIIDAEPEEDVGIVSTARDALEQGVKAPADLARRALKAATRPKGLGEVGSDAVDLLKTANEQLHPAGSELWRNRSRRRHAEALSLPFDDVRAAAHALGGTINDFFLTGAVEAARRYHLELGVEPKRFHVTFVVSTHTETDDSPNAFSPVPVELPAGPMSLAQRFETVRSHVGLKRSEVHGGGPLASMAAVANLLPTPMVTGLARDQAGHIDFATSNLPGFVGDTFVAGAKTLHSYPFGPVAGTPFNLTMLSMAGVLDLGVNIDPAAVTEPELLASCLVAAYADLLAAT
ncbi:wax ester/triacylglycerol synthase domain-containing protein [Nodularia spumigena]|uniref:wax ester/triacylglycerol synthase domain-containing protein n=1 Tax=Nodularia spumigena TaxID=70799 RepID=UPI002B1FEDE6|nr:wax ester/triacylglycerol synthase domain-containing protein [Nodularia spumigena]MEA5558074.1 wax ester/triacylglycerol synthase domain-containing protein [Nodularia spumigena CH309]